MVVDKRMVDIIVFIDKVSQSPTHYVFIKSNHRSEQADGASKYVKSST